MTLVGDGGKVLNKPTVVGGQPHESLQFINAGWSWPVPDGSHRSWISSHPPSTEQMAHECRLVLQQVALGRVQLQPGPIDGSEDFKQVGEGPAEVLGLESGASSTCQ